MSMGMPVMESEVEGGKCAYAKLWGRIEGRTEDFEAFVRQVREMRRMHMANTSCCEKPTELI